MNLLNQIGAELLKLLLCILILPAVLLVASAYASIPHYLSMYFGVPTLNSGDLGRYENLVTFLYMSWMFGGLLYTFLVWRKRGRKNEQ